MEKERHTTKKAATTIKSSPIYRTRNFHTHMYIANCDLNAYKHTVQTHELHEKQNIKSRVINEFKFQQSIAELR